MEELQDGATETREAVKLAVQEAESRFTSVDATRKGEFTELLANLKEGREFAGEIEKTVLGLVAVMEGLKVETKSSAEQPGVDRAEESKTVGEIIGRVAQVEEELAKQATATNDLESSLSTSTSALQEQTQKLNSDQQQIIANFSTLAADLAALYAKFTHHATNSAEGSILASERMQTIESSNSERTLSHKRKLRS